LVSGLIWRRFCVGRPVRSQVTLLERHLIP
jgi:hypothetical protein